jgi:hypothetical protein
MAADVPTWAATSTDRSSPADVQGREPGMALEHHQPPEVGRAHDDQVANGPPAPQLPGRSEHQSVPRSWTQPGREAGQTATREFNITISP